MRDGERACGAEDDNGNVCDWSGTVAIDYDAEAPGAWWDCPACGTEHEEELP